MQERKAYAFHKQAVHRSCQYPIIETHYYRFKTHINDERYVVRADLYPHDLFVVKFYLWTHRKLKSKYTVLTKENAALRIIFTCVAIGLKLKEDFPNASFGFVGNPTQVEKDARIFKKTKRYRVYEKYAKWYFDPANFEHSTMEDISAYLMLNKKKMETHKTLYEDVKNLFESSYNLDTIFC